MSRVFPALSAFSTAAASRAFSNASLPSFFDLKSTAAAAVLAICLPCHYIHGCLLKPSSLSSDQLLQLAFWQPVCHATISIFADQKWALMKITSKPIYLQSPQSPTSNPITPQTLFLAMFLALDRKLLTLFHPICHNKGVFS